MTVDRAGLPTVISAGYTLAFDVPARVSDEYPPAGWQLVFTLISAAAKIEITAAESNGFYSVSVPAGTTAGYAAGTYRAEAAVSNGTDRHRVSGPVVVTVEPDLAAAATFDTTTHAERVLASIEAVIEGRATRDQEEYSIDGRSLKRTPIADLIQLRSLYRAEVARERDAAAVAEGRPTQRVLKVRF